LLVSQYYLKDGVTRFQSLDKQVKENTDTTSLKSRFFGICFDMALAAEECAFTFGNTRYAAIKQTLLTAVGIVDESNEGPVMKEQIRLILNLFEDHDYSSPNTYDFVSNVNRATGKYTPMDDNALHAVARSIVSNNNRAVTLFDPRCRDGKNVQAIKEAIPNSVAYGLEMDTGKANVAKTNINKVIRGSLTGSKISNDAFDVMFLEAPISWAKDSSLVLVKQEKIMIHSIIKYLRPNGVFVLAIPYFKLHREICIMLARYYDNIQVRRIPGAGFYDQGLVIIMGQRKMDKEIDEKAYSMLRHLYDISNVKDLASQPFEEYTLPETSIEIQYFRGSVLDEDEMAKIVSTSGCFDAFWKAQEVEKLSENQKEPCLPFNIGQLGLVLTSGCLDGVVNEGEGFAHAIKGRVSKKTNVERDVVDGNIEVTETITNRVEINTFLPNGEYKVLA
jgi:hypothetical protein